MKRLDQLNSITQEALGGLTAGQDLKLRILAAFRADKRSKSKGVFRPVPVLAMAAALAVAFWAGTSVLPSTTAKPLAPTQTNNVFESLTAGHATAQPGMARALLDVPPGSITLSAGNQAPEYRSIWAPASGSNFPLIGINGKFYRLMRNPSSISQDLVGSSLGQVNEYTDEPALASTDQIISNVVSQGEAVYAVSGMDGALAAAQVDGSLRVFQRVSFANNATQGSESLSDTLCVSGRVVGLELSGVGTITDENTASSLVGTLLDNASFDNASGSQSSNQALLIELNNGLVMQLFVKGDTLSACGSWTCPEFFEAFQAAVQ